MPDLAVETLADMQLLRRKLAEFLEQPLCPIGDLKPEIIPETTGIYAFYEVRAREPRPQIMYVGIVTKTNPRRRLSTGLRFRICENHCGFRGEDNFRSDLRELRRLDSLQSAQEYLKNNCACRWLEERDLGLLRRLEHFAIALLIPPFNDRD